MGQGLGPSTPCPAPFPPQCKAWHRVGTQQIFTEGVKPVSKLCNVLLVNSCSEKVRGRVAHNPAPFLSAFPPSWDIQTSEASMAGTLSQSRPPPHCHPPGSAPSTRAQGERPGSQAPDPRKKAAAKGASGIRVGAGEGESEPKEDTLEDRGTWGWTEEAEVDPNLALTFLPQSALGLSKQANRAPAGAAIVPWRSH